MAINSSFTKRFNSLARDTNVWSLLSVAIVCFICIPLFTILLNLRGGVGAMWDHIMEYLLLDYVLNSIYLIIGAGFLSLIFGVPTAWLISNYEFKFRKVIDGLSYIPLAVPSYIMSYVYVGMFGFGGTMGRLSNGVIPPLDMMNIWGLMFVLGISLYPYVYASSRVMFSSTNGSIRESTQLLGATKRTYFWKIALPMASPAIIGGLFLVFMEVLNDYGAAKYYGVNTFTTGIFRTWTALEDLQSAVFLATLLVGLVLVLMSLNKVLRGRRSFASGDFFSSTKTTRSSLTGIRKQWLPILCSIPCVLGFVLPVLQLLYWASFHFTEQVSFEHILISLQSLVIAVIAAAVTVAFSVALVYFPKWNRIKALHQLVKVSTVGYIIPGAVIGITLIASSSYLVNMLDDVFQIRIGYFVYSSAAILLFAYLFRFLAVAYNPIEAHALRIGNELSESSYLLGKSRVITFLKIDAVLLKNSFLTGFLVVFIDVIKELPLTLLLKPYHVQTLAIKAYEFADDERVSEAALPSLTLILIVCLAMWLVSKFRND